MIKLSVPIIIMKNIYFGDTDIEIILNGDKLYLQNLIFENNIG